MLSTLSKLLVEKKGWFFSIFIGTIILCFATLKLPQFNGNLDGFDVKSNPEFIELQKVDSLFSNSNKYYLLIKPSTTDRKKIFAEINALTKKLESTFPEVRIISPFSFYMKMIRYWKTRTNNIRDFYQDANEVPLLKRMIGENQESFVVVISTTDQNRIDISKLDSILLDNTWQTFEASVLSEPHLNRTIQHQIKKDLSYVVIGILSLFVVFFLLAFRGLLATVYMLSIVLVSILSGICLFSLFGYDINMISLISIPVILILSLSDSLHLLAGYNKFKYIEDKKERIKTIISHYLIPSFYSSFTTAVAFFSFYLFSESEYIRELGLITAVALMVEFVATYSVSPLLLWIFDIKTLKDKELKSIALFFSKHKKPITYLFIGITLFSLFFIQKLGFESHPDVYFPKGTAIKADYLEFKENYFEPMGVNIVLQKKQKSQNQEGRDSLLFQYVKSLANDIRQMEDVLSVGTATDEFYFLSKMGIKVNLFNYLKSNNPYYHREEDLYLMEIQLKDLNQTPEFVNQIKQIDVPEEYMLSTSSRRILYDNVNESISISLLQSLLTSGIGIFLILTLLTRSLKIALLSFLPNMIPLGFIVLVFYFLNIDINYLTALTLVIGLGLLDDDTVHILYRRLWLKEPMDELNFSILSSALLLSGSFLMFTLSSFQPIQIFGWITALLFIIGVLCELSVMQWILDKIKR